MSERAEAALSDPFHFVFPGSLAGDLLAFRHSVLPLCEPVLAIPIECFRVKTYGQVAAGNRSASTKDRRWTY